MVINLARPISTLQKTKDLFENDVNPLQYGIQMLWQLLILMELKPFWNYFLFTNTLNMSNKKWKLK